MPLQEDIAVRHNVVAYLFQATNIPDAAGVANSIEPTSPDYQMPFPGTVIGISVRQSAALATGTLTWRTRKNGTANTLLTTVTDSTRQGNQAQRASGDINLAAGDRLSVDWTKSGTISATTTDAAIVVLVLHDIKPI